MSGKKPDQSAAKVPSNASQKQEAPQSPKPVNQDLKLPPDDTSIETNEQQDLESEMPSTNDLLLVKSTSELQSQASVKAIEEAENEDY